MPTFFNGIEITNRDKSYQWAIYSAPDGRYVSRRWEVMPGGAIKGFKTGFASKDINELRDIFRGHGLFQMVRQPDDALNVIETWI